MRACRFSLIAFAHKFRPQDQAFDAVITTVNFLGIAGQPDRFDQRSSLQGLARAYYWQRLLDAGEVSSGSEIAQLEGLNSSTVNELLRLTLLDPALVLDILDGKPPQGACMMWFTRNVLPELWHEQFVSKQNH